jgi:DNA-binding PadR family transcriptional regulator
MKDLPRTQRDVLNVLNDSGRIHAYEIKLRLRDVVGHSSVYAALAAAEAKGYVTGAWESPDERPRDGGPPRKYYELTEAGRAALYRAEALVRPARRVRGEATS